MTTQTTDHGTAVDQASSAVERADLLAALAHARFYLRFTTRDLTDDQARMRTTASAFTLAGVIKHVTEVERGWAEFLVRGKAAMANKDGKDFIDWSAEDFTELRQSEVMGPEETLADVLAEHERVAAATDATIRGLGSLDTAYPLPKAPWPMDEAWSLRRTILHILAETTQHAGHADIIRESLDGAKSMG
ncbi:DinB family protein [Ruania zhangjianzhongii]|uniref:DinB family protein n=1 Tax=Ruania zhangjianzhongii TaxID=2603206 RepID=UPI0011C6F701|nr:DinB family protein [Ruania zhangjianzhongii]